MIVKVIVPDSIYARVYFARGEQGAPGATGATGATGSAGAQGIQGIQGIQGPTGATGATGAQGPQGVNGLAGDKYHTTSTTSLTLASSGTITLYTVDLGLDYSVAQTVIIAYNLAHHMHGEVVSYNPTTGALVVDLKNKTGSGTYNSWTINLNGAVGIQGIQGPTGATGATGPQGPQGIQGVQGEQGIQGPAGATGATGSTGATGATGAAGTNGTNGTNGLDGLGLTAITYLSGNLYTTPAVTRATGSSVANYTYYTPFIAGKDQTFTKLAVNISAGKVDAVVNIGFYSSDANGRPGTRMASGTVDASTSGAKEVTGLSISVTKGQLYWLASQTVIPGNNLTGFLIFGSSSNSIAPAVVHTSSVGYTSPIVGYYTASQGLVVTPSGMTAIFGTVPIVGIGF